MTEICYEPTNLQIKWLNLTADPYGLLHGYSQLLGGMATRKSGLVTSQ